MSLKELIIDNYGMIFELIGILIMLAVSVHITESKKRHTAVIVVLLFLECVCFYLERWTQTFETLSVFRPLLTAAVYSLYPVILIVLTKITAPKTLPRWLQILLLLPEIVSVPVFFSSQWTHLVFVFMPENKYSGGLFPNWPYVLFALYTLVFLVSNVIYFRKYAKRNRFVAAYIVFAPILGAVLYLLIDADKDYTALFTSSIVLYFIYIYIHYATIDPLTALFNRQSYYKDLESNTRSLTAVVSVDMNDLKKLNDNMGHEAGDEALVTVANVIRDHCGKTGHVYRVGGDEFMILYFGADEPAIRASIKEMKDVFSRTAYTCAFGYAMREWCEDVSDTVRLSDKWMYENKAKMKRMRDWQS